MTTLAVVKVKVWIEVDPNKDIDSQIDDYLFNTLEDYELIKDV